MAALDALLDGFADEQHPPEWKGKFRPGDKVRVAGKDGGVVGRVVRPADAKPRSHVVIAPKDGGAHVEAEVGRVRMDTPEQHAVHAERAERKAMAATGPAKPVAVSVPSRAASGAPMKEAVRPEVLGTLLQEATLTAKKRSKLPKKAFAIPETESYPIHDEAHARNALSRVAQHGSDDEKKRVRAAVKRRYPNIGG